MLIKRPDDIPASEITPESVYRQHRINRRQVLALAKSTSVAAVSAFGLGATLSACAETDPSIPVLGDESRSVEPGLPAEGKLSFAAVDKKASNGFYTEEAKTPYRDVTSYNNFYEFGTDKHDPKRYAGSLTTEPWSLSVEGEVDKPGLYPLEDILKLHALEERIYRLRCVEAWSMVIPWVGFPLADLIKRLGPTSKARYVAFETLHRPEEMRGQRSAFGGLDWPYREGLRIDEAVHPLTFIAVGLYGRSLPNQNGAPLRLVVPWKYGFKSIKSIVKIRFSETQPLTSWNMAGPQEYGFYSNVNPEVNHPRWSQASERRLPSSLFNPNRIPTLPFNGYGEQVAGLYKGMNLKQFY